MRFGFKMHEHDENVFSSFLDITNYDKDPDAKKAQELLGDITQKICIEVDRLFHEKEMRHQTFICTSVKDDLGINLKISSNCKYEQVKLVLYEVFACMFDLEDDKKIILNDIDDILKEIKSAQQI